MSINGKKGYQVGRSFSEEAYYSWAYYYYLLFLEDDRNKIRGNKEYIYKSYENIRKVLKNDTSYVNAWLLRGNIALELPDPKINRSYYYYWAHGNYLSNDINRNRMALDNATRFLKWNPSNATAWNLSANILDKIAKDENNSKKANYEARKNYYLASFNYFKEPKDLAAAENYINKLTDDPNNNTIDSWFLKGLICKDFGKRNESIEAFNRAFSGTGYMSNVKSDSLFYAYINISEILNYINEFLKDNPNNAKALWIRGEILHAKGDNGALSNYSFALSKFYEDNLTDLTVAYNFTINSYMEKNSAEALNLEGRIYEREGKFDEALKAFNNANNASLFLTPACKNEVKSQIFFNLGKMHGKKGNYKVALENFDNSIITFSNSEAWINRGIALFRLGRYNEAKRIFDRFFCTESMNRSDEDWIKIAEIRACNGWHNASLNALCNVSNKSVFVWKAWYNRGLAEIKLGHFDQAIKDLDLAMKNMPEEDREIKAKAWMNRALANSRQGKYDDALCDIGNATELSESLADIWYVKGLILLGLEQPEEAQISFHEALRCDCNDSSAVNEALGRAYALKGNYSAAIDCYGQCTKNGSKSEQAWIDKGITEKKMGNRRGESLISFDRALKAVDHNRAKIWCDIGYTWKRLPKQDKLLANKSLKIWNVTKPLDAFNKSIEIDPNCFEAHYNKSLILNEEGKYGEALNSISNASAIEKSLENSSSFHYYKGVILRNLRRADESFIELDKSYRIDPFDLDTLYLINELNNSEPNLNKKLDKSMKDNLSRFKEFLKPKNNFNEIVPTAGDITILLEKLNQTNKIESLIWDEIADVKYDLGANSNMGPITSGELINEALQAYMMSRKLSQEDADPRDNWYNNILKGLIYFLILLAFVYLLFSSMQILGRTGGKIVAPALKIIKPDHPIYFIVLTNLIGFFAFSILLSKYFDISRAFFSLIIQIIITIFMLVALWLLTLNKKDRNSLFGSLLPDVSLPQNFGRIKWHTLFVLALLSSVISAVAVLLMGEISREEVQIFMLLILTPIFLITAVPFALHLSAQSDMRNIIAIYQSFYIAIFAVPLSWLLWSFGIASNISTRLSIEDISIPLPIFTVVILLLIFVFFIYPYCLCHRSPAKPKVEDTEEDLPAKVWRTFVTSFIGPSIAMAISLVAPLMRIPLDQPDLTKLITDAVSQAPLGF